MKDLLTLPGCSCQRTPAGSILVELPPLGRYIAFIAKLVIPMFLIRATKFFWGACEGMVYWQQLGLAAAIATLWIITVFVVLSPVILNFEFFAPQIIVRKSLFGYPIERAIEMRDPWNVTLVINSLRGTKQGLLYAGDRPTEILSIAASTESQLKKAIQEFIDLLQHELKIRIILKQN